MESTGIKPWASCQIRKIEGWACAGNAGNVFPPLRVSYPNMHHGTCVTHVQRCMSGSLTSSFPWNRWRGKTFLAFAAHAQPQFYVSGKRPIAKHKTRTLCIFLVILPNMPQNQAQAVCLFQPVLLMSQLLHKYLRNQKISKIPGQKYFRTEWRFLVKSSPILTHSAADSIANRLKPAWMDKIIPTRVVRQSWAWFLKWN